MASDTLLAQPSKRPRPPLTKNPSPTLSEEDESGRIVAAETGLLSGRTGDEISGEPANSGSQRGRNSHAESLGFHVAGLLYRVAAKRAKMQTPNQSGEVAEPSSFIPLAQKDSTKSPRDLIRSNEIEEEERVMRLQGGQENGAKDPPRIEDCTVSELAHVIYDKLHEEELPNFITHVRIKPDGGLERIHEIWDPQKYLWCVMLFAVVIFNVVLLVSVNWGIFQSAAIHLYQSEPMVVSALIMQNSSSVEKMVEVPEDDIAKKSSEMADIFKHIEDSSTRNHVLAVGTAVASFEVLYVLYFVFIHTLYSILTFAFAKDEFRSYEAISDIFRLTLPQLGTFSALKLIRIVHPVLVYGEFLEVYSDLFEAHVSKPRRVMTIAWFVCSRIFFAAAAVAAFAVKILAVGLRFINPHLTWCSRWAAVVALLNNCMGIILVERLLQERVYLFVFGGRDCDYQMQERALLKVYQARVCKQIWQTYWCCGERLKAIVLLTTLDHYDLQRLLIDDFDGAAPPPDKSAQGRRAQKDLEAGRDTKKQ